MTEQRYGLIMKFLHFKHGEKYDPENQPNIKLWKIFDAHSFIIEKFKTAYILEKKITLNKSLTAHKGFLGWKQYILRNRVRFGMKLLFALLNGKKKKKKNV